MAKGRDRGRKQRAALRATHQSDIYQKGGGGDIKARLQKKSFTYGFSKVAGNAAKERLLARAGVTVDELDGDTPAAGAAPDAPAEEAPFELETGNLKFAVYAPPQVIVRLWERRVELRKEVADLAKEYGAEPSQSNIDSLAELLQQKIVNVMCFDPEDEEHAGDGKTNMANACVQKVVGEIAKGDAQKMTGDVQDAYPVKLRKKDDNEHSIKAPTEFRRVCGGAKKADALMELHLECVALDFLIRELAHGKVPDVAAWGEDARALVEVLGDAVNSLGEHMHPMAATMLYRGFFGSLDYKKHFEGSDRCLTAIAERLGMTVLGKDGEIHYWRNIYARDAAAIEEAAEEQRRFMKELWADPDGVFRRGWADPDSNIRVAHEKVLEEGWAPGGVYDLSWKAGGNSRIVSDEGWAPGGVYDLMMQRLWAPGGACRRMVEEPDSAFWAGIARHAVATEARWAEQRAALAETGRGGTICRQCSEFVGVSGKSESFAVSAFINGTRTYIGTYDDEHVAGFAVDIVCVMCKRLPVNYPDYPWHLAPSPSVDVVEALMQKAVCGAPGVRVAMKDTLEQFSRRVVVERTLDSAKGRYCVVEARRLGDLDAVEALDDRAREQLLDAQLRASEETPPHPVRRRRRRGVARDVTRVPDEEPRGSR